MPRANPSESIEVAARHLFRHLDEPAELRRNPIVAHYFEQGTALDALLAVRRAVRQAAEHCERDDRNAGLNRQAQRNARLLEQLCTRGGSYRAAASALGLSVQQYYRVKQQLCLRVARVMSRSSQRSPRLAHDPTDLALARLAVAEKRAGVGEFFGAQRICADVAAHAPSALARIRALCLMASVERQRCDVVRSRSWLAQARAVLEAGRDEMAAADALVAECHIKLWSARVAFDEPDSAKGLQIIEDALERASTEEPVGDGASRAVLVDLFTEGAEQHEAIGDFERAKTLAALAAERAASLPESLPQKSHIARTMSRLQWVAPGVHGRPKVASRLANFHAALELARSSGSVENEVRTLLNLMSVHVVLGDPKTAMQYSEHALRLAADFGGRRLAVMTRLEMTDALIGGSRWRLAGAILPTLSDAFAEGSYNWLFCKAFEAIYLAKIGEPERSIIIATASEERARAASFTRISGGLQRVIASSANMIGRKMLAHERIRASIETVYRGGSLLSLGHAYRVAAAITGERRYTLLAREIGMELAV
jgi:tetratricopeptide (TPR) repeat protein